MNIVLGFLIVSLTTFLGYAFSLKYSERKSFYSDFADFNYRLKNEINFTQSSVLYLLKEFNGLKSDYFSLLNNYISYGQDKAVLQINALKYLKKDEKDFVLNYFKTITSFDKYTEISFVNKIEDELNKKLTLIKEDNKKYKSLAVKMGFLIGLILFIIIL